MSESKPTPVTSKSPEVIEAAKWWADILRSGPKMDNGDDSPSGSMAAALAMMARQKVEGEILDRFEIELRKGIAEEISQLGWDRCPQIVSVDYGPDRVLSDALERAGGMTGGIMTFPWKTIMWISPGEVKVQYGYGAKSQIIYPKPEELRC